MIFQSLTRAQAVERLRTMAENTKWNYSGQSVSEVIGSGDAFVAIDGGAQVLVFVVDQVQHENGRELVIRLAWQLSSAGDLTERVLPEIEKVFGFGCDTVTIYTMRRGLVQKLHKAGYAEVAKIMRKTL